ncbi:MAG: hypothetical protein AMXMBFR57_15230 [Acidimicrobiia bacterium]|jgi:hypothetical protein
MNESMLIWVLFGGALSVVLARLATLERRLARLSRLEAKVDALLDAGGVTFDPLRDVPTDVRTALEQGETILAIRRFREATGASLKEARDFVV